ncbi:MAG: ABC transporter ATP-binding protein [Dehalococcoidia bacterium]|nr:MAG: ABC transporter ATP-binding protein [Dehalococcoidia bacterium]
MGSIIELRNVDKTYAGAIDAQALFGVDLSFEEGSCSSIMGESGSGKSTLLNIMGTLDVPTRGEVFINGQRTDTMGKNRLAELRNETIGFVFQYHYLLPEFTAIENALIPYLIKSGKVDKEILERAEDLFDMMGISNVKNNAAARMSGGQQQRTAIVRALINNPRILLADEPTGNLDSRITERVCKNFREINERFGTTFVVVTHNSEVAKHTDRVVKIQDGRIEADI